MIFVLKAKDWKGMIASVREVGHHLPCSNLTAPYNIHLGPWTALPPIAKPTSPPLHACDAARRLASSAYTLPYVLAGL